MPAPYETLVAGGMDSLLETHGETVTHTAASTGMQTNFSAIVTPQQFVFDSKEEVKLAAKEGALVIQPGDRVTHDGAIYAVRSARVLKGIYRIGAVREGARQ